MRGFFAAAALLVALAPPVHAAGEVPEQQTVTPITPPREQRVEPVNPNGEQRVEALDTDASQGVSNGTKSPARRVADKGAKAVVGVFAAAVSVGVMVASLLLI